MMKNKKSKILIGFICIMSVFGILVAILILPKAKTGGEIAELLRPIITAKHQSMDVDLQLTISGKKTSIQSTMYLLTEEKSRYLVVEQDSHATYLVDNVLYLENGQAFLFSDTETEVDIKSIDADMFAQIAALYEALEITTTKEAALETYTIEVSGEEAYTLLSRVMPEIYSEMSAIDSMQVHLTAKEEALVSVSYTGGATVNGKEMSIELCIDNFRVLEKGAYVIPENIQIAVENVDKDALFCITKDLYRLMLGFADLASQENIEGKVTISANSGAFYLKKTYDMSELKTGAADLENSEALEQLPDVIAPLCTEGEISCTEETDGFHYTMKLNKKTMGEITESVLPRNVAEWIELSKGYVEIVVNGNKITSIEIGIAGSMQSLFSKVQSQVGIEFIFD